MEWRCPSYSAAVSAACALTVKVRVEGVFSRSKGAEVKKVAVKRFSIDVAVLRVKVIFPE